LGSRHSRVEEQRPSRGTTGSGTGVGGDGVEPPGEGVDCPLSDTYKQTII